MPNKSKINLMGHLGRDAELKQVGDNAVLKWTMAVTHKRKGESTTTWYSCELWGTRAESLAPYMTKGKAVDVDGDLRPREYRGKNDELRISLDVNVKDLQLLGGDRQESAKAAPSAPVDDESIPF